MFEKLLPITCENILKPFSKPAYNKCKVNLKRQVEKEVLI